VFFGSNGVHAMSAKRSTELAESPDKNRERWALTHIVEALRGLQFGQITVAVQDGVVVQVERTERRRFQRRSAATS
jgi:hypothetical protein